MAFAGRDRNGKATADGCASPRRMHRAPNRYSSSTCRDQWPSQLTREYPGFSNCEESMVYSCISGPLMVGHPKMTVMSLQRSIRLSGVADILLKAEQPTSRMPTPPVAGFTRWTVLITFPGFSIPRLHPASGKMRASRDGFLGYHESINSLQKVHYICYSSHQI